MPLVCVHENTQSDWPTVPPAGKTSLAPSHSVQWGGMHSLF